MEEWLDYLRERRAHLAKLIVLMRQDRVGQDESISDTSPRMIEQMKNLLERFDEVIAEIEQLIASRSNRTS